MQADFNELIIGTTTQGVKVNVLNKHK